MNLTPAQRQYLEIKEKYKDAILFFRMGDFYEVFYDDAKICAKILDIALTSRDKNSSNPIPMAGIPYHAVEKYLPKLLEAGYKVAIAEQVGEVVPGKVVERKVTQVITPGTYVKEQKSENNILALWEENGKYYLAWGDISTGIINIEEIQNLENLQERLFKIYPKEIILPVKFSNKAEIQEYISNFLGAFVSNYFLPFFWKEKLLSYVKNFESYGKALDTVGKRKSLALLIDYLENLSIPINILKIKFISSSDTIYFDSITIRNLEILSSNYDNDKKHSLFAILDKTITNVGSRTLKKWLLHPLKNLDEINYRLNGFEYFIQFKHKEAVQKYLKQVYDIERLSYLIQFKSNNPFHWLKLKISLNAIYEIFKLDNKYLYLADEILYLRKILNEGLADGDFSVEKDFIKDGFSSKVDELRKIAYHSDKLLIDYQQELVQKYNLPLKIKYINNQGYLLEVSKKDVKKFEEIMQNLDEKYQFTRKQTLKLVERYTNNYLKNLEEKILQATFDLQQEEKSILEEWKKYVASLNNQIEELATQIAYLDIFINLGEFFVSNNYTKPLVSHEKEEIVIKGGRHPVIEQFLDKDENFVENDLLMKNSIVHIITGPNMGGKSTYLRQNALILLLVHCGLFVPAKECKSYVLSGIFARVGSGDVLVKKQSTFMTEMIEVANILNNADEESFIIFDELGRGTSTYDGMAISQAVIEYIVEKLKSKTLFATHYHELIKIEEKHPNLVKNFSVGVHEYDGKIVFLKKILPGGADKSYGIYVAQLAGLPKEIISKAKLIEQQLDKKPKKLVVKSLFEVEQTDNKCKQIKEILENLDISNTTPLEALNLLNDLKNI